MRAYIFSDAHFEHGKFFEIPHHSLYDVVIAAGDICSGGIAVKSLARRFPSDKRIIFVAGNHEYYGTSFEEAQNRFLSDIENNKNISWLRADSPVIIDGTTFIGDTLWTDFGKAFSSEIFDDLMQYAGSYINDFSAIKDITPELIYNEHVRQISAIEKHLEFVGTENPVVVVTHHAPSSRSVHQRFRDSVVMNRLFHSSLEPLILRNTHKIKMWVHGHMHDSQNYMIGHTEIICNPVGYPHEKQSGYTKHCIIDI